MKLSTLLDPRFQAAFKKLTSHAVALPVAQKIKALVTSVQTELTKYEADRKEIILRLGEKNADGTPAINAEGTIKLAEDAMAAATKEVEALISKDLELAKIALTDLGNDFKISADELFHLEGVIDPAK